MRVVVTGAHGFVGLNVAHRLAAEGHHVIAVGRREPDAWVSGFLAEVSANVEHRVADLGRQGSLAEAVAGDDVDAVVHAAVITATTAEVEREASTSIVAVNIGGTIEALDLAQRKRCRRFVYVSSPAAIGASSDGVAIDESVITNPQTLYGITKQSSELLSRRYGEVHGLSTVSVRIAQPYGPGERATPSRPRTSPIWEWLAAASRAETLITGPLGMARDWTWIGDTARGVAILATADRLPHDLYHLSVGRLTTVGEVVGLLRATFPGLEVDEHSDTPQLNPNIAGPGRRGFLDTSRFAADFGWSPAIDFDEGMRRYLTWWNDR